MHKKFTKEKDIDGKAILLRQKKKAIGKWAIAFALILVIAVSGCTSTGNTVINNEGNCADSAACGLSPDKQVETSKEASNVEKIEVYHFHGTNQCYSCKTVGAYAEETVKTFFAQELESGKVVFGHINGDLPENQGLVKKYEVTSASLWIGVYKKDGGFSKEQNTTVWYKINNKSEYLNYLKGIIENKLKGN